MKFSFQLVLVYALAVFFSTTLVGRPQTKPAVPITQFGKNLLTNPGAETEGKDDKDVAGWRPLQDGFTGVKYGSTSGEWDWGLSGCKSCGNRYLRLAFEGTVHELSIEQTIDVTPSATEIAKSHVTANISAYLGAFLDADTTSTISASFQEADGKELGKIESKPYDTKSLPKAEKGGAGLTLCEASGVVPAATKKIVFTWRATATGASSDYLALGDNFALVLSVPPPPNQ